MIIARYILITFLFISFSMTAYIEKLVALKDPITGKMCFVCFDNHTKGTVEENTEQADFFIDILIPRCQKKLGKGKEKLGIFFESVYFYKFFEREKLNILKGLELNQQALYSDLPHRQTTWITWQLPNRLISRHLSDSSLESTIVMQSIDPRLPLIGLRNSLTTLEPGDTLLPLKSYALQDIETMINDVTTHLISLLSSSDLLFDSLLRNGIINIASEISKKIKKQHNDLKNKCKEAFEEKNENESTSSASARVLFKELHDDEFNDFLSDKNSVQEIADDLEDDLFRDDLFSEILDLMAFISLVSPTSPKYSMLFIGSAHAQHLVKNLKTIGYQEINLTESVSFGLDENNTMRATSSMPQLVAETGDVVKLQAEQIPSYITSNKSKSVPDFMAMEDL